MEEPSVTLYSTDINSSSKKSPPSNADPIGDRPTPTLYHDLNAKMAAKSYSEVDNFCRIDFGCEPQMVGAEAMPRVTEPPLIPTP